MTHGYVIRKGEVRILETDLHLPHPGFPDHEKDGSYNLNDYWEQIDWKIGLPYATLSR